MFLNKNINYNGNNLINSNSNLNYSNDQNPFSHFLNMTTILNNNYRNA